MLKIVNTNVKIGTRIILLESWQKKFLNFNQFSAFPYEFIIDEIIRNRHTKQSLYICKSVTTRTQTPIKIALSQNAINYLFATEVCDLNIGLSFEEYYPIENSELLITSILNPNEVIPGIFKTSINIIEVHKTPILCIDFQIDFINGNGFTNLNYYTFKDRQYVWKFLLHDDISHMTDYEKMFRDTLIHKSFVKQSCEILAQYLETQGATNHADALRKRALAHDDSKINNIDELSALSKIINDRSSLMDPTIQLSTFKIDYIKLHWSNNSHHPEFFSSVLDMTKLDIMEMCCDWHARSLQHKTNFLDFVEIRQQNRFHFPNWMYEEIKHYCNILANSI